VAQEGLKAVMKKFTPLRQWMYLGCEEVVHFVVREVLIDLVRLYHISTSMIRSRERSSCLTTWMPPTSVQLRCGSGVKGLW
jgi:hypothetical protein